MKQYTRWLSTCVLLFDVGHRAKPADTTKPSEMKSATIRTTKGFRGFAPAQTPKDYVVVLHGDTYYRGTFFVS